MIERPITHHELLAAAGRGDLDACAAPLRGLGSYLQPVAPRRLLPVVVAVCDQCDVAIEVTSGDAAWSTASNGLEIPAEGGGLAFRVCYPYRPNVRVGKRKRKGH